ncbi:hypothetical protein [Litorimonas sp. WD9-15]|uniref:hypothetical protein n=1 Tax=Litorimonas sp. WD9-15 TaxID=3418716 RepID=UPI003D03B2D4
MNISNQNLGELGESTLRAKLLSENIASTKPVPDINGGDLEIYWPEEEPVEISYDKTPSQKRAFLQIKSTNKKHKQVTLSLSSAKKLVDKAEPSFVVAMVFNDSNDLEKIYLFHINEFWIEYILKRLRNCTAKNKSPNKSVINFPFSKGLRANYLTESIGFKLGKVVTHDLDDYTKKKIEFKKECGYDKSRHQIQFQTAEIELSDLVSGFMGDKPIPVLELQEFENRFGITLPSKGLFGKLSNTEIFVKPSGIEEVSATIEKKDQSVSLQGVITSSDFLPMENEEWQYRFSNSLFTFVSKPNKGEGKFTLNAEIILETLIDVKKAYDTMKFLTLLSSPQKGLLSFKYNDVSIELDIEKNTDVDTNLDILGWLSLAKCILSVWEETGHEPYLVKLNSVNSQDIFLASEILSPQKELIALGDVTLTTDESASLSNPNKIKYIGFCYSFSIGTEEFAVSFRASATLKLENSKWKISCHELTSSKAIRLRKGLEEDDYTKFLDKNVCDHQDTIELVRKYGANGDEVNIVSQPPLL